MIGRGLSLCLLLVMLALSLATAKLGSVSLRQRLFQQGRSGLRENEDGVADEHDETAPTEADIAQFAKDLKRGPHTAFPTFLETESETKVTWPPAANSNAQQIRTNFATAAVAANAGTFAPCTVANIELPVCTLGFRYVQDSTKRYRTTKAYGEPVAAPNSAPWVSGAGGGAIGIRNYVRALNADSQNPLPAAGGGRNPLALSMGHIIAASLGGSNNAPLNFFPQREGSNNAGNWHTMEQFVAATLTVAACTNKVDIIINFNYAHDNDFVPSGGTYTAGFDRLCVAGIIAQIGTLTGLGAARTAIQGQQLALFTAFQGALGVAPVDGTIDVTVNWAN